ncbi:gluconate 2-dehydrogenase subunit 3 family protein [Chryseolinea sp. H1M3-3]|uniref:gluconate 2-dehydrogenase subunit 3 family protein n=1 Tax=Chryseolinea sp. H1M3-3 TaxID=3034144 RepID=UPI0023EE23B3|nr:gluconate 2-dehydrogenase subunit 3 family protein [Chryseolinea sp. H1M3-3]
MNRREAISAVGFLVGGTVIGAQAFLTGCSSKPEGPSSTGLLTNDQISFMNEVGETILPTTPSSPGAKEAKVGEFMDIMLKDCYSPADQKIFMDGIATLDKASESKYDKSFVKLKPEEKHELLLTVDAEASKYKDSKKTDDPENHYYSMMKQLTLLGYFTSEIGATKALNHVAVPGHYEACVPLKPGQKAWS